MFPLLHCQYSKQHGINRGKRNEKNMHSACLETKALANPRRISYTHSVYSQFVNVHILKTFSIVSSWRRNKILVWRALLSYLITNLLFTNGNEIDDNDRLLIAQHSPNRERFHYGCLAHNICKH